MTDPDPAGQCPAERHTRSAIYSCVLPTNHEGHHQDHTERLFETFVEALTR